MLFYDGIAHKLSQVRFNIPLKDGKEDYLSPWTFSSDDGRFEMRFVPILDRSDRIDLKLLLSDQHQVFGRYSGTAELDSGVSVEINGLTGFAAYQPELRRPDQHPGRLPQYPDRTHHQHLIPFLRAGVEGEGPHA